MSKRLAFVAITGNSLVRNVCSFVLDVLCQEQRERTFIVLFGSTYINPSLRDYLNINIPFIPERLFKHFQYFQRLCTSARAVITFDFACTPDNVIRHYGNAKRCWITFYKVEIELSVRVDAYLASIWHRVLITALWYPFRAVKLIAL